MSEIRCHRCDAVIEEGQGIVVEEGYHFCSKMHAVRAGWRKCEDCGRWMPRERMHNVYSHGWICEECAESDSYVVCDDCGNLVFKDDIIADGYGTSICPECEADHWYWCVECNRLVNSSDVMWDEDDRPYCEYCFGARPRRIRSYGYKPRPQFLPLVGELEIPNVPNLYLGVELEVDKGEDRTGLAADLQSDRDWIYCKSDGSLENGVEIVSHPHTLRQHMKDDWCGIMNTCLDYEFRSHDTSTCGLHVHVNRDFFGPSESFERDLNIAKVILLVNKFWESHVIPFTRRKLSNLERWAAKSEVKISRGESAKSISDKVRYELAEDRYHAVNLTNYNTIEFRMFRGTLKYSTFLATLQFVDTLCRFAKKIALDEIDNVKWEDIFADVDYPELRGYLAERTDFKPELVAKVLCDRELAF